MFGERVYKTTIDNFGAETDKKVLVENTGEVDVSSDDFIEKLTKYTVSDVWLEQPKVLKQNIPPLTSVEYFVYSQPNDASFNPDPESDEFDEMNHDIQESE